MVFVLLVVLFSISGTCFAVDNPIYSNGVYSCPTGEYLLASLCFPDRDQVVASVVKPVTLTTSPKPIVSKIVNQTATKDDVAFVQFQLDSQMSTMSQIVQDQEKLIENEHSLLSLDTNIIVGILSFLLLEIIACIILVARIIRESREQYEA